MQRIIRDEEPLKPSTKLSTLGDTLTDVAEHRKASPDLLQKLIRGDLDWIVMKSLEKDRTHRYETASELARDIERHLGDEPVEASPPSIIYRMRKFVRKHRGAVAMTATVVAALITMVIFWAIAEKKVKAQKLLRDLELAEQYLQESRFDLALGLGLSAQQRFPSDPRVLKIVRRAKGSAKLSVKFGLGIVRKATLKRIAEETGEPTVDLPISELLSSGGIDVDAGWYWLTLVYETNEGTNHPKEEIKKYLLFIRRETPYEIQVRRLIIGNVPDADFVTLEEALLFCQPGNILCLAAGKHRVPKLIIAVPNISIESKDYQQPAIIRIGNIHVCDTWDIRLSNLKFEGPYAFGRGNVVGFENSVLCKVTDCTFVATGINAANCDGVELSSNFFLRYAHNRGHITNSKRVILRNNTVHPVLKVYKVTNGSPAARAGLRSQDEIISVDGKPLGLNMNFSEAILAKKGKVLTLVVGRESDGKYAEVVITIKPQWEKKGNRYLYDLNISPGGRAWGTFYFQNCQVVLALNNQLARSALHGLLLVGCTDVLLAGNTVFQNAESNIIIDYTHEAIICYNELVAGVLSNLSLFGSDRATVQHNIIRGAKVGVQLEKSEHSDYINNLILENQTGILCSSGIHNHVETNIFLGNKQCVAAEKYYWGSMTVETNLMDSKIDPNSMENTWLTDRNNAICAFELEKATKQGERSRFKVKKANNYPNLDDHEYGPALSLKSKYLDSCNNMASMVLEFSQLSESLPIEKELGNGLADKTSDLAKRICLMRPPQVDEKSLGKHLEYGHPEVLRITRSLTKLYIDDRRYDKVGPILIKAMETARCILGENHPRTLDSINDFAWFQATCPVSQFRDGIKAIENATKTCELTNWKDYRYVGTLAAAYAEVGDFKSAVKWEKKAIDLIPENKRSMWLANYESRLNLYRSGKCYRAANLLSFSTRQMVGWWKLDQLEGGNVIDSSGNNLHGKLESRACFVSDPVRGNVLSLDGFADYVHCGYSRVFDITDEITLAAWIKVNIFDRKWRAIVTKGDTAWRLQRNADSNGIEFACTGLDIEGTQWGNILGSVNVNDGKWHHVTGVYDGNEIYLYVDGTLDKSKQASGLIETNDYAVMIGENAEGLMGREWKGLIDDVRIYSYALSETEVKELYAGRGPGPNERPE